MICFTGRWDSLTGQQIEGYIDGSGFVCVCVCVTVCACVCVCVCE